MIASGAATGKLVYIAYKLAAQKKAFFLASICRANTDPPVTKIPNPAMGFFLGVDQH